jgi:nucleoid-associated protein YgaU
MGNLEKLGILVMVILVVVVGVVAITPQERVTAAFEEDGLGGERSGPAEQLAPPQKRPFDEPPVQKRPIWPPDDPLPSQKPPADERLRSANVGPRDREGGAPLPPPHASTYTVRKGENMFSIAKSQLGDGARWHELVELNPSVDPDDLREGDVLRLPSRGAAPEPAPRHRPEPETYVVRDGDTLSEIASRKLGKASRWERLLKANSDQLERPEDLRSGMRLKIPAAEERKAAPRRDGGSADSGRTYTVKDGDSLARIARRVLGNEARWQEIQRLNADLLKGGTDIRAGMVLRLPR